MGRQWFRAARSGVGVIGLTLLVALVAVAVIAPVVLSHAANATNLLTANQGPGRGHLLGTDGLGRDVFARTLVATRVTLELAVLSAAISAVLGVIFGLSVSGLRGWAHTAGARVIDASLSFPDIFIAIVIITILSYGGLNAAVAVGIAEAPWFARVAYSLVSAILGEEYVVSARVAGVPEWRILVRHVLPNVAEPLSISALTAITYAVIAISSLSFLGLGVQPPGYDWGSLITVGLQTIYEQPAQALAPAAMLAITGVCLTFISEAFNIAFNPQTSSSGVRPRPEENREPALSTLEVPADDGRLRSRDSVLVVTGLRIAVESRSGPLPLVRNVSFSIGDGESVGLVGESGSGKTLTALAVGGLTDLNVDVRFASLRLGGVDLLRLQGKDRALAYRGTLSYVFQDPATSMNPALRIGAQLREALPADRVQGRKLRRHALEDALREVGLPDPGGLLRRFPHELSGGQRQRVMIAMALLSGSKLLFADEPTTALDVTVQKQVLDLLRRLNTERGLGLLLISHNLAVVAETCDRVMVMYGGRIVEEGPTAVVLRNPRHPYTAALLSAVPELDGRPDTTIQTIGGRPPRPEDLGRGCAFSSRCQFRISACDVDAELEDVGPDHRVACWVATRPRERAEA